MLSTFLTGLAEESGPESLNGAIVLAALERPLDRLIQLALGLGPYHPGKESPWSHSFLIAENYRGPDTRILDCTIRNADGTIPWDEPLDTLLSGGIAGSGGIYEGTVSDYDDLRVTAFGTKVIFDLTPQQRIAVVAEGDRLRREGYHYDLPGLVRELVRLLTGIVIPAGDRLLFCSAFCQAAYRLPLGPSGDFAPEIATEDTTPDDIWYSPLGNGVLPPPPSPAVAVRSATAGRAEAAIEHIVVLMMENRSFDHMLGSLSLEGYPVNGLKLGMFNFDSAGTPIPPFPAIAPTLEPDPHHDLPNVLAQLRGPNGGFVTNYEELFDKEERRLAHRIMSYYDKAAVPVFDALAREYGVSDAWHCSVPSETWPNRLFAHAASSDGRVTNGLPQTFPPVFYKLATVYDQLGDTSKDWRIYDSQLPQCVCIKSLLKRWINSKLGSGDCFRTFEHFATDCAAGDLPKYSFIEPDYFGGDANDDHPPHDIWRGQELVASVYNSLRSSTLWERSLLVILYDEHGGLFDHVVPPAGVPPPDSGRDGENEEGFDFSRLGPRVPCLLVSPWISKGTVARPPAGGFLDHTSLIATVAKRWGLPPLTPRSNAATDLWPFLALPSARVDDRQTADMIRDWRPPTEAAPQRAALKARDTLRAPVGDVRGQTPRQIVARVASLRRDKALLARAMPALEAAHPFSAHQEALIELAEAIDRTPDEALAE